MNNNNIPTREELLQQGTVIWDRDNSTESPRHHVRLISYNGIRYLMRERNEEVIYIANYVELDAKYGKED